MPKYGEQALNYSTTTSRKSAIFLTPVANRRCEVVELIMTGAGQTAPADVEHNAAATYATSTYPGDGTNVTPQPFAQGSAAATGTASTAFTTETGSFATVFPVTFGFNQRGGQRWSVPQGEGIRVDSATTNQRLGWRVISSTAGAIDASMNHWED